MCRIPFIVTLTVEMGTIWINIVTTFPHFVQYFPHFYKMCTKIWKDKNDQLYLFQTVAYMRATYEFTG